MARVTVEDCIDKVPNRFELVLLAAHRARAIAGGQPITVERDNDKNPVVALREIAEETVSPADLKELLIHSIQKQVEVDEPEPEETPVLAKEPRMPVLGQDDPSRDTEVDRITVTEDELRRGMENAPPTDMSTSGARSR